MKNWRFRCLPMLLAACMLLSMPAAMMEEALPKALEIGAEALEAPDEAVEAPVAQTNVEIGEFAAGENVTLEAEYAADLDWNGPVFNFHDTETGMGIDPEMQILLQPDHEGVPVSCTSSDESIATVDDYGVVTAYKKFGQTRIELTYEDGAVYVVRLSVNDPSIPRNIELHVDSYTTILKGKTLTVDYSVRPGSAPQTLEWSTSEKSIATVSKKGVVKGIKAGTATITATAPTNKRVTASFYVKVVNPDSPAETGIPIDASIFPNDVFREYVQFQFDVNNDARLSDAEIAAVKSMDINGRFLDRDALTSLKGIERFTALEALKFSNLPKLKSVDLSGNKALKTLSASDDDALASLNLSKNTALTLVDLHHNPKLKTLNVTGCKELTRLEVCECALTSLNVKNNTQLEGLLCWENALKSLDVTNNRQLVELDCTVNKLSALNVKNNTKLEGLYCSENALKSLDVTNNRQLVELDCSDNKLSALNVKNNTKLETLYCGWNAKLAVLDVTRNTKLKSLVCGRTAIKTLDISNCSELIRRVKTVKPEFDEGFVEFTTDDDHQLRFESSVILKGATVPMVITASKSATYNAYKGIPVWVELDGAKAKSFTSSKTAVATVNKTTGLVTPKKVGTAKITVTPIKGSKVVVTLRVASPTDPIGVSIKQGAKKTLAVKKTLQLTAALKAVEGYTSRTTLTWQSDNTAVATVNKSTGKVTAVKKGKANITVKTKNGLTATIAITVK